MPPSMTYCATLSSRPSSETRNSVVRFPTGRITSCLTVDHNRALSQFLSPERPAYVQPRRRPTPRHGPDSPPHEPDDNLQDDITYALSALWVRASFSGCSWSSSCKPIYSHFFDIWDCGGLALTSFWGCYACFLCGGFMSFC